MRIVLVLILLIVFGVGEALASSTRTIDADQITSSNKAYNFYLPAQTGNLMIAAGIVSEIPSGTVNGSNTAFVLSSTPLTPGTVQVFLNGIKQELTTDYTFSTATITFVNAPVTGQSVSVVYSKY